jgi:hypothetical protein
MWQVTPGWPHGQSRGANEGAATVCVAAVGWVCAGWGVVGDRVVDVTDVVAAAGAEIGASTCMRCEADQAEGSGSGATAPGGVARSRVRDGPSPWPPFVARRRLGRWGRRGAADHQRWVQEVADWRGAAVPESFQHRRHR